MIGLENGIAEADRFMGVNLSELVSVSEHFPLKRLEVLAIVAGVVPVFYSPF